MKHFKPEGFESIMQDTLDRTISIREGVGRMFALFPSSMREEITEYVLNHAGIREGFSAFLDYLKSEQIEFYVTSGGIDFFVDPLLKLLASRQTISSATAPISKGIALRLLGLILARIPAITTAACARSR